ncbi:hypothetical protein R3P38DRAFT_2577070 [Favolaschia claudopus]|uniref:F-box domain-containing protein n=1 Tax=Favolaschia claudopus TaxID=2862362 RepID=A0AAV9ZI24_9AGAR
MPSPLPWDPAIYLEIGRCCNLWDLLELLCVSSELNVLLRHYLYRHIGVRYSADKLVDTLAKKRCLWPIVRSLFFEKPGRIRLGQWERVLPKLCNLEILSISAGIPLPLELVYLSRFRLTHFAAECDVQGTWIKLIASQPWLQELRFNRTFLGPVPAANKLPLLVALKARPIDCARFAEIHELYHIWFYTGDGLATDNLTFASLYRLSHSPSRLATLRISCYDFLAIVGTTPHLLTQLRHLVLDEDLTWSEFTLGETAIGLKDSTWARVALSLNSDFQTLQGILLVCDQKTRGRAHRRRLERLDAWDFAEILYYNSGARPVRAFRFYAHDGYAFWTGLGTPARQQGYYDYPDDPWMVISPPRYFGDDEYAHLFGF